MGKRLRWSLHNGQYINGQQAHEKTKISMSLVTREMQIKSTRSYHYTTMTKMEKTDYIECPKDVKQHETHTLQAGM